MRLSVILAVLLALAIGLPVSATPRETPPPGMAKYVMVVWEPGTPLPGKERKLAPREVPDVARLGGRVLMSNQNQYVIYLPKGQAKGLRHHAAVMYLQRIWTGESFDDWDEAEAPENDSRARIASDSDPDLNWGPVNYTYDGSGNVKSAGGDAYTYDSAGRLIQATVGGKTETYKYDSFGNLIEKAIAGSTPVSIPVDGGSNRMIGAVYDAAGNVVSMPDGNWYTYASAGMMATVDHVTQRRNIYDADDERIRRTFGSLKSRWTIRDLEGRVLREFVSEHPGTPWVWEQDHVYAGGTLAGGEVQEWGYTETYRYAGRRHYHLDHLGSVRMVTNDTRRAVALRDYYPYGVEQTPSWQEPLDGNNFIDDARFTGHERDFLGVLNVEGSDYLDYMHARFYEPNKGRFLSPDPVLGSPARPQSWNRYSYVENTPLSATDPTGMVMTFFGSIDVESTAIVFDAVWDVFRAGVSEINDRWTAHARKHDFQLRFANSMRTRNGEVPFATTEECRAAGFCNLDDLLPFAGATSKVGKMAIGRRFWTITQIGTDSVVVHRTFGTISRHSSTGLWWSRDLAGHGGSAWKVFEETPTGLRHMADADVYGNFIVGKHKGPTGQFIPWSEVGGR